MLRSRLILGLLLSLTIIQPHPVYAEHLVSNPRSDGSSAAEKPVAIPTNDQTDQEKMLGKQNELDRSLQEFDDMLLRRKDILSKTKAGQGGGAAGGPRGAGNGTAGEGVDEKDSSGELGTTEGNQGSDVAGEDSEQSGQGSSTSESNDSIGASGGGRGRNADLPGTGDDDIVARQLREAAEKETDPALKKKLWEEYRNYKKNGV